MNAIATARPSASPPAETAALYEGAARQMALHLLAKHVPTSASAAVAVVRAAGEIYASFVTAAAPVMPAGIDRATEEGRAALLIAAALPTTNVALGTGILRLLEWRASEEARGS